MGEAVDKLRSALKKKPVEEEEEEEERPPTPPPKKISIADEIAATFSPEQSTIGGVKTPTNIPMDWRGSKTNVPDVVLKAFYRKSLEAIRDGKKLVPFNDKQLLRGFDMIDAYESETEESDDED